MPGLCSTVVRHGRTNLHRVELLHQARFAASSIVSMNNTFFGGAIKLADCRSYCFLSVLCACVNGLASLRNLRFDNRFHHAVMQAAFPLLAHAFLCGGIIGHLSTNPPR